MSILITVMIMVNLSLHASNYLNDDTEGAMSHRTFANVHLTESIVVDGNQPPKANPVQEIQYHYFHHHSVQHKHTVRHNVFNYYIDRPKVTESKRIRGINLSLNKSQRGNISQFGNTQPKESFFDFFGCTKPHSF